MYISKLGEMVIMVKMLNLDWMVIMIVMIVMVVMVTKVIIVMIIIRDNMVIMVDMVIMVEMIIMVEDRQDKQDRHVDLTFQVTCVWQLSKFLRCLLKLHMDLLKLLQ